MDLLCKNRDATLSDIAQHAGVGRTTLYRLYKTKGEIVKAVAVHCLDTFDQAAKDVEQEAQSALHAIHLLFKAMLPLSAELEFLMKLGDIAEDDPEVQKMYHKHHAEMAELVELAKTEGSINPSLPTPWIVNLIEGLFYTTWVSMTDAALDNDRLADLAFESMCSGIEA